MVPNNLKKQALFLAGLTIAYNLVEAAVAVFFGVTDDAISLAGFGGDSLIEVGSATVVLWNLKQVASTDDKSKERVATRAIGALFILLSLVVLTSSSWQLYSGGHPETTMPGLIVALASISVMFYLWRAKLRVAKALDSSTLEKDAVCTLVCIRLSFVLLAGSLLFLVAPDFWWLDAVCAILIGLMIMKEGVDTVRATYRENFSGGCGCD